MPLRADGDGPDPTGVALERLLETTRVDVPDPDGLIPAPRDDAVPVGLDGRGVDRADVTLQNPLERTASRHQGESQRAQPWRRRVGDFAHLV